MEVKVLKKFRDKHTGEVYKVGKVLKISEERLAEIESVSKDLVAVIEAEEVKAEEPKEEKPKKAKKAKKAE